LRNFCRTWSENIAGSWHTFPPPHRPRYGTVHHNQLSLRCQSGQNVHNPPTGVGWGRGVFTVTGWKKACVKTPVSLRSGDVMRTKQHTFSYTVNIWVPVSPVDLFRQSCIQKIAPTGCYCLPYILE